jgi:hypothetical protein
MPKQLTFMLTGEAQKLAAPPPTKPRRSHQAVAPPPQSPIFQQKAAETTPSDGLKEWEKPIYCNLCGSEIAIPGLHSSRCSNPARTCGQSGWVGNSQISKTGIDLPNAPARGES